MTARSGPAPRSRSEARQRKLRRTWPQRFLIAVGVFSTFSLLVAAAGFAWGLQRFKEINFLSVPTVEAAEAGEPVNWLLVGSDSREGIDPNDPNAGIFLGEEVIGKRTDTIIVARVDPELQTIDLLSVPRDLWVTIDGTGERGRVNSAFNGEGGEQRLVATVENFLDIEINNYAEINFIGFQAVIDALGGVPIWFDNPVRDPSSALDVETAGCHNLSGFDALAFARSRHLEYQEDGVWVSDPTGDLGRTARQQYLLSRLADTASANLDLADFGTVDQILRVAGKNLVIDDGASATDLFRLARTFSSVGSGGIVRHALPVSGFRTSGGASVLQLDFEQAQPTLDLFRGGRRVDPTLPPSTEVVPADSFVVDIQNGARVSGLAGETADGLQAQGFRVGTVGDSPEVVEVTTLYYPSQYAAAASAVGPALGGPVLYQRDDSLVNVLVVVGKSQVALDPAGTEDVEPATPEPAVEASAPASNEVGIVPGPGPEGTACG